MGIGILPKTQAAIDLFAGLAAGIYRAPMRPGDPGKNDNAHYIAGAEAAQRRLEAARRDPMPSSIYPAIFWAERLLVGIENPHICDFGGGYGEPCVQIGRMLPRARFTIVEVPGVVEAMKPIAPSSHSYTDTPPATCDLLFSNGVTMNAHEPLLDCVSRIQTKAVIITGVETTPGETFWSMQVHRRFGRRTPYITFNPDDFASRIASFGYELRDMWTMGQANSGPFIDGRPQPEYRGFAFARG